MSNLFILTNYFTVISSESLISHLELNNNIAIIEDITDEYYNNIEKNLNKYKWDKYYKNNYNCYTIPVNKSNLLSKQNFDLYNKLKKEKKRIEKIIEDNNIEKVFLPKGEGYVQHNLIYQVAEKHNIEINLYEEGLNFYLTNISNSKSKKSMIYSKIKFLLADNVLNYFFIGDEKYLSKKSYSLLDCDDSIKYSLAIDKYNIEEEIKNIDNLYISQPLSEVGILSVKDEIEVFKEFLDKEDIKEITIKYHPRDSKEKINKFLKILKDKDIKLYNLKNQNIPAEKILLGLSNKSKIYGYTSSTLVYASEIFNVKVYSLGELLLKKKTDKVCLECINMFKNKFKNILYV